jgi:hypothetical protein
LKWQVFLASKFGGLFSRVNPAGCHGRGGSFWWIILAHLFGGFSFFMANETSGFQKKEKQSKDKKRNV